MKLIQENDFYYLVNSKNERITNNHYQFIYRNKYIIIHLNNNIVEIYGNKGKCFKDYIIKKINNKLFLKLENCITKLLIPLNTKDMFERFIITYNFTNKLASFEINPYLEINHEIKNKTILEKYPIVKYCKYIHNNILVFIEDSIVKSSTYYELSNNNTLYINIDNKVINIENNNEINLDTINDYHDSINNTYYITEHNEIKKINNNKINDNKIYYYHNYIIQNNNITTLNNNNYIILKNNICYTLSTKKNIKTKNNIIIINNIL